MLALSLAVTLGAAAEAAIYQWVDEAGTVHFTDNLESVPPEHRGRLRARDDRLPPPPPVPRIPLTRADPGYLVDVRIDGRVPARLVIDTGASVTVVSPAVARRLGARVERDPPVRLRTAGGTVEAGWAEVDGIEVGGRRVGPLRVVVHDAVAGADGLLGMDFLGAFRVEIQAEGPTLLLTNP